ncbi:hypothetical protein M378DRAFT_158273 [Amanita muscaria Koide BX008]|uniref:Uncharacterized protein n=1 Tax=Amanita muscaria (strain Koide BX008) TaxID=946122 RepID=A0A0C2TMR7_AMAMK|nr:hypothetical protein M378DRAFT_158273 [Amanita muscaria Koide BX008]
MSINSLSYNPVHVIRDINACVLSVKNRSVTATSTISCQPAQVSENKRQYQLSSGKMQNRSDMNSSFVRLAGIESDEEHSRV